MACGTNDAAKAAEANAAVQEAPGTQPSAAAPAGEVCRVANALRPLPDEVHESSGVAVSRRDPRTLWTHNDSGEPYIYAISSEGKLAGRTQVAGAKLEDWEDIAAGPCPSGNCLYIADIGDNRAERPFVTVYRVPEPAPGDAQSRPAEAFQGRYPDGPHDAEAMFVLPGGEIYVLTKGETGPVALYKFPASAQPGQTVDLQRVREFTSDGVKRSRRVTGADASTDGKWVAVRTLNDVSLYQAQDLVGGGTGTPREMDLSTLKEAQGEGIAFASGSALILTSEGGKKKDPATFARLECALQ